MLQYLTMLPFQVIDRDGNIKKVKNFRKRIIYSDAKKYKKKMLQQYLLRIDLLSHDLYGSYLKVGGIIDCNDIDILSFSSGDDFYYADGDIVI